MNVKEFYSDLVFRRTYAKTQGETWTQAVNRYARHFRPLAKKLGLQNEFEDAIKRFKNKELVGSMRGLATAGKALELYPEAVYNCSYLVFNDWSAFADMFILLMLGVGVGYSIEKHTLNLPKRPNRFIFEDRTITPQDSKEGWRDSFYELLITLQAGVIPSFDYSLIRPAGAPLKTFGGTASGYKPLKFLFEKTIELFTSKPGEAWTPVEVFDLANLIANAVISGGVRRSACIALVDKEDAPKLKPNGFWTTHPWRAYSNISVTSVDEDYIDYMVDYWREHRTGEPGFFNREEAKRQLQRVGREAADDSLGTNPCFTYETKLWTDKGQIAIGELENQHVKVWSPIDQEYVDARVFSTGVKDIIQVSLSDHSYLRLTPDHRLFSADVMDWVEAQDSLGHRILHHSFYNIKPNSVFDPLYLKLGFIQGDGSLTSLDTHKGIIIHLGENDYDAKALFGVAVDHPRHYYTTEFNTVVEELGFDIAHLPDRTLPTTIYTWTKAQLAAFLRGLYGANGSVITNHRIALKTTSKTLAEQVQALLKEYFDINSYITTNKAYEVEFNNGTYMCKESYDLNISQAESVFKFAEEIGFLLSYRNEALKELIRVKSPKVLHIKTAGREKVYDFSMVKTHAGVVSNGLVVHNCGEVLLRPFQFCNLTEVNASHGSLEDLEARVKASVLLGILQGYETNFSALLNPAWSLNAEAEPLLGVSLTGLREHPVLQEVSDEAKDMLNYLHDVARAYAKAIGQQIGKRYTAVTTVKPSGTVSQVLGTTAGIHNSYSKYVIRRLRINSKDPLVKELKDYPVNFEPDIYSRDTLVMSFPLEYPNHKTRDTLEQLEYYLMIRKHWTDHNPSATITITEDMWDEVKSWLKQHYKDIIGITFLPESHTLQQAPYEAVSKEEYEKALEPWKHFHKSKPKTGLEFKTQAVIDASFSSKQYACSADGGCELDEL